MPKRCGRHIFKLSLAKGAVAQSQAGQRREWKGALAAGPGDLGSLAGWPPSHDRPLVKSTSAAALFPF